MKTSLRERLVIATVAIVLSLGGWQSLKALRTLDQDRSRPPGETPMTSQNKRTEQEWRARLTPEQFRVMRECGTEPPFSGTYNDFFQNGIYHCAGCGTPLFRSETKYDHGTGWPSFTAPLDPKNVLYLEDDSYGMKRTEVRCAVCGAHLGHVFDDGPPPSSLHYCINSAALDFRPAGSEKTAEATAPRSEVATFAAGCFWGVEREFRQQPGVLDTVVGYTGGQTPNPTYAQVCTDETGHAESIQATFDPDRTSYEKLVRFFFSVHDPTQVNRQGPDVGTQYRSVIFYHSDEQLKIARQVIAELEAAHIYRRPIATQLVPASEFYKAEEYHQRYYEKKGKK
jgi:peptide methionine sulfoxide reductase msrA/msrB